MQSVLKTYIWNCKVLSILATNFSSTNLLVVCLTLPMKSIFGVSFDRSSELADKSL